MPRRRLRPPASTPYCVRAARCVRVQRRRAAALYGDAAAAASVVEVLDPRHEQTNKTEVFLTMLLLSCCRPTMGVPAAAAEEVVLDCVCCTKVIRRLMRTRVFSLLLNRRGCYV